MVGLHDAVQVSAGSFHSLAVLADGTLRAWGVGSAGRLGDGGTTDRLTPVRVVGLDGVSSASGGGAHSLAMRTDGTLWAWGNNAGGEVGDGTQFDQSTPVRVKAGEPAPAGAVRAG